MTPATPQLGKMDADAAAGTANGNVGPVSVAPDAPYGSQR
jgi:hypothetical protein